MSAEDRAACRWCPPGCKSCEPDDCECYTHQDEPDRATEDRSALTDADLRGLLIGRWEGGPIRPEEVVRLIRADRDAAYRAGADALREATEGLADEWDHSGIVTVQPSKVSRAAARALRAVLAATRPDHEGVGR